MALFQKKQPADPGETVPGQGLDDFVGVVQASRIKRGGIVVDYEIVRRCDALTSSGRWPEKKDRVIFERFIIESLGLTKECHACKRPFEVGQLVRRMGHFEKPLFIVFIASEEGVELLDSTDKGEPYIRQEPIDRILHAADVSPEHEREWAKLDSEERALWQRRSELDSKIRKQLPPFSYAPGDID